MKYNKLSKTEIAHLFSLAENGRLSLEQVMMAYYGLPCRRVFPKWEGTPDWYEATTDNMGLWGRSSVLVKPNSEVVVVCQPLDFHLWNPLNDGTSWSIKILSERETRARKIAAGSVLIEHQRIIHVVDAENLNAAVENPVEYNNARFGGWILNESTEDQSNIRKQMEPFTRDSYDVTGGLIRLPVCGEEVTLRQMMISTPG